MGQTQGESVHIHPAAGRGPTGRLTQQHTQTTSGYPATMRQRWRTQRQMIKINHNVILKRLLLKHLFDTSWHLWWSSWTSGGKFFFWPGQGLFYPVEEWAHYWNTLEVKKVLHISQNLKPREQLNNVNLTGKGLCKCWIRSVETWQDVWNIQSSWNSFIFW